MLKSYLPELHNFLEYELKLDLQVVFASWSLTLFTTSIQFNKDSKFLDQLMDIFMARGWIGFLQCLLVIMDSLQDYIFSNSFENCLIMFTELSKNQFDQVTRGDEKYDLKKKIAKFKRIDENDIALLSVEYNFIKEKLEDYWHQLSKKLNNFK